jgi:hypothetical protein
MRRFISILLIRYSSISIRISINIHAAERNHACYHDRYENKAR